MNILGIETSCDETAAAVVRGGLHCLSNIVASQVDYHREYGGVVPEIASRKHVENIVWVVRRAIVEAEVDWGKIHGIAVTAGPGLLGALLVGISTAKAIAYAHKLPLIACNHLEGHLYSLQAKGQELPFPSVALLASGGHTNLYHLVGHGEYKLLGQTRDDAVGEAFDKVAKMLKLGYPGGPVIDRLAAQGNPAAINFPRTYLEKGSLDFSLSGIKTAVLYYIQQNKINLETDQDAIKNIAASFQQAVVDVLVNKTLAAARQCQVKHILLTGGVACNSLLRRQMSESCISSGFTLHVPPPNLCTDNAAMVACLGYHLYKQGKVADLSLNAFSH